MNTSSRVPGLSRNSGWQVIDAQIADQRRRQRQDRQRLLAEGLFVGLLSSAEDGTPERLRTPTG